ncbi:MAG: homoserine O-acetyltransferase [Chitinophagaceae bacterium]|nr:homoserine O-acetyltransferase [Chitinophagaceae bacterium]
MHLYNHKEPFQFENGIVLPEISIAYHVFGKLNADKSNVVWVCHHLTANSNAVEWWPGMVGAGCIINPDKHFIVCANILGSCYGTTGPLSNDPGTGQPYYSHFPFPTIRDMVKAHILLRKHLGIDKIHLLIGGSMGGYQALEWCVMEKDITLNLILLATSPAESAWGIAIHTAQRLAIEADHSWQDHTPSAGSKGLKAARAIGMLTYRSYNIMVQNQTDPDIEKFDNFKASSYINYQGDKLAKRFNAYCYWLLTKSMDSHNIARGRDTTIEEILRTITQRTLLIGITNDILCPIEQQQFLADHIHDTMFVKIDSTYGHDGFMVETEKITSLISNWLH